MIAEAVLLDALEAVHSGRLRVHEAYRTIRAAESRMQLLQRTAVIDAIEETQGIEVWGTGSSEAAADHILTLLNGTGRITLTREECEHAADWHDYIVDQGGEMPAGETEIALRLRAGAAL